MYLTRWNRPEVAGWPSIGRLSDLREEIDRLFESPLAEFARSSNLLSGWSPALDVYEEKDQYVARVELPGMKKEDIELSLHDGALSISGERKFEEKEGSGELQRSERYFGRFQRTVTLPGPVAADKVSAHYKDGILTVTLPKTEEAKPRQIPVSVN